MGETDRTIVEVMMSIVIVRHWSAWKGDEGKRRRYRPNRSELKGRDRTDYVSIRVSTQHLHTEATLCHYQDRKPTQTSLTMQKKASPMQRPCPVHSDNSHSSPHTKPSFHQAGFAVSRPWPAVYSLCCYSREHHRVSDCSGATSALPVYICCSRPATNSPIPLGAFLARQS